MNHYAADAINISMKHLLPAILLFALMGCASTNQTAMHAGGAFRERNEGYSLLYKLVSDESEVSNIFILKSADEPVKSVIKEIAEFMQSVKKQMDEFPKSDARIEFDVPDLPRIELKSRELQAQDERNGLLFSSGEKFALRLIFTQAEATNYATQLAKSLAEIEDDAARKSFLTNVAKRSNELHDKLMILLIVKS